MLKRCLTILAALALLFGVQAAEQPIPSLDTIQIEAGTSYLAYPQLSGMADDVVQGAINAAITNAISAHHNTLLLIEQGLEDSLRVDSLAGIWPSTTGHGLLYVLITAQGRMPSARPGHQQIPLMFDLENGQMIGAADVFLDSAQAQAWLEQDVLERYEQDLSNYLNLDDLIPFPIEHLLVDPSGISFYYPENSLTWLSGRNASLRYLYHEILPLLNLAETSLLSQFHLQALLEPSDATAVLVSDSVNKGVLPGLDAHLGEVIEHLLEAYPLLHDPEGFVQGEVYQLEDDAFRGSRLICEDDLTLTGILSRRMNLFGLITGQSAKEQVESALGAPFVSLPIGESAAMLYGLVEGSMSAYLFGERELQLYFNQQDVLDAVWLKQKN